MQQEVLLSNHLSQLECLLDKAEAFLEQCGVPAPLQFKIKLVLDELFTNIVSYGYPDHREDKVRITLCMEPDAFRASIDDGGIAFNPLEEAGTPNITLSAEERPVGGLGIHLVKNLSRDIQYRRIGNRNEVTFWIAC